MIEENTRPSNIGAVHAWQGKLFDINLKAGGANQGFELSPLPYAESALEPYISTRTLEYHYGKHHKNYLVKLNSLLGDAAAQASVQLGSSLISVMQASFGVDAAIFNNAAQVWNHSFYWESLCSADQAKAYSIGANAKVMALFSALSRDFGSLDDFKTAFNQLAMATFGSGWAWLVLDLATGKLSLTKTSNADSPYISSNQKLIPLLTADVWEHAYYLDYQNARNDYLTAFWQLVNWSIVADRLAAWQ